MGTGPYRSRKQTAVKSLSAYPVENFGSAECPLGYAMPKLPFRDVWSMDNVVAECKKRGVTGLDAYVDNVSISTVSFAEHCNTLATLLTVTWECLCDMTSASSLRQVLGFWAFG